MPTAPPAAGKPESLDPPGQREIGGAAAGSGFCLDHRTSPVPGTAWAQKDRAYRASAFCNTRHPGHLILLPPRKWQHRAVPTH